MFTCNCNFSKAKTVLLIVEKIDKHSSGAYEFLSDRIIGKIFLTTVDDDAKFQCFDLILTLTGARLDQIVPYEPPGGHKKEKQSKNDHQPKKRKN